MSSNNNVKGILPAPSLVTATPDEAGPARTKRTSMGPPESTAEKRQKPNTLRHSAPFALQLEAPKAPARAASISRDVAPMPALASTDVDEKKPSPAKRRRKKNRRAAAHAADRSLSSVDFDGNVLSRLESGAGRTGVSFLQLGLQAVALKQSPNAATEALGTGLAAQAGYLVSPMRIIGPGSAKAREIAAALRNEQTEAHMDGAFDAAQPYLLMNKLKIAHFDQIRDDAAAFAAHMARPGARAALLRDLGKIMAFDLMVFNFDRFKMDILQGPTPAKRAPMVGFYQNTTNIFVMHDTYQACLLDPIPTQVPKKFVLKQYAKQVHDSLVTLLTGTDGEKLAIKEKFAGPTARLVADRAALTGDATADIDALCAGLLAGIARLASVHTRETVTAEAQRIQSFGFAADSMEKNLGIIRAMLDVFVELPNIGTYNDPAWRMPVAQPEVPERDAPFRSYQS